MTAKLRIGVGACSDKGLKEENQDSLGHFIPASHRTRERINHSMA
jgi:hypothetical protein